MMHASPPPKLVEPTIHFTTVDTVPGHTINGEYIGPRVIPFITSIAEAIQMQDGEEEKEYCPIQELLKCTVIWKDEEKGNGSLQIEFNDIARGSAIDWRAFVVELARTSGRTLSPEEIELAARMAQISSGDWVAGLDPQGRVLMLQKENHTASFSVQGNVIVFDFDPRWEPIVASMESINTILGTPGVVIVYDQEERDRYAAEQIEEAIRKPEREAELRKIAILLGIDVAILIWGIRKFKYGKG